MTIQRMAPDSKKNAHSNPLLHAGIINKVFFWWLKDLIWYGKMYDLGAEDLYDTVSEDLSEPLRHDLEKAWRDELNNACVNERRPNLWKVIIKTYWWDFIKCSSLPAGFSVITIAQPELLRVMMSYFRSTSTMSVQWAYFIATLFVVLTILRTILFSHSLFQLYRLGMQVRIACTSLIYKKMIRLSATASRNTRTSVISLLSIDVARFEILFAFTPYIAIVPVQLLIVSYLIWRYVGINAALIGIVLMILLSLPLQVLYTKVTLKLRTKQTSRTDKRIFLIGEVINGIRAVKMYVWEKYFVELVRMARRLEISGYAKISYLTSVLWSLTTFCHRLCVFVVILIYVAQNDVISTHTTLPVTQHFYNLRLSIIILFFYGVRNITDMHVSMKRIEDFLLLQEVHSSVEMITDGSSDVIIWIDNVTASWDKFHVLENINLKFAPKSLYAIVGSVGSGKSSLLKLMLGELPLVSGKVSMYGKISYANQEPWLFPGSIRDNILFGELYDEKKYDEVVKACALVDDFNQLPHGDQTWVGEKGINLSGGQCARINLARAVYRDADVYLLDNPLSAVDSRVAKMLMEKCINGLLKNSTRIVVTPNYQQLNDIDEIILFHLGKVEFRGSGEEFEKNYQRLQRLPSHDITTLLKNVQELKPNGTNAIAHPSKINDANEETKETAELIAKGAMKMSVYSRYITAGGLYHVFLLVLFNCFFVVSVAMFDLGLAAWNQRRNVILRNDTEFDNTTFIGKGIQFDSSFTENSTIILGGLIVLIISTSFLVNFCFHRFALNASSNIHHSMFSQLMKTTLRFFEMNPSDRILNRFSEDTSITDNALPLALFETMQAAFHAIALLLSAVIVNWWIAIPGSISIFIFVMLSRLYVTTIQKIKRLVGNAKSPILAFTASSLAGLTTIRACKAENIVSHDFDSRQDHHTEAQFLSLASVSAISLWIELINLGLLASVVYICVILKNDKTFEGYVGLSLMQVFNMTMIMSFLVKRFAEAFANMTSVERMLQFTDLEQESSHEEDPNIELPNSWPEKGEIKFQRLYLRYLSESDPVLWNLNFTIEPGTKIGVVGRSGAGKSSLISALFRLAKIDGSLLVDGIDIKKLDLPKLRSKLSIIPQESAVFSSTLRKNLDPFDQFDDAVLWSALQDVKLKQKFDSLDCIIGRGGRNLSLGQRQLLCLARAIIKKNKILILDEATANVDSVTDTFIQKLIRIKFRECTVIVIAHRLNTIMDSDRVLVLDNGRVIEYDHPYLLLQNNDGYLFKIVEQTGNAMMEHLTTIAEQAYQKQ